jgi:hypothetical protein
MRPNQSCGGGDYGFLRPLNRPDCRCPRERLVTLLARWRSRGARSVAHRVLCAAPDAVLRVLCVVPVVVPLAPLAVPDAARYQTSLYPWAPAWRESWSGLPPLRPSEPLMMRPLRVRPRIQKERVLRDGRFASALNVRSFSGSR